MGTEGDNLTEFSWNRCSKLLKIEPLSFVPEQYDLIGYLDLNNDYA